MTSERWARIQELFFGAIALKADEREEFIESACAGDSLLRRQLESLIQCDESSEGVITAPVAAAVGRAAFSDVLAPGERVGTYSILRELGRGGMGAVYLAARAGEQFKQNVAIKVVRAGVASEEVHLRFRVERQILANLNHPNIARLLDGGVTPQGLQYLVMEFVEGVPLDSWVAERGLGMPARLKLFREVCDAVQYAHQNLVVHRDLKPSNILVTPDGTPKLLDFGIAKLLSPDQMEQTVAVTAAWERLMTPEYASPEQVRGQPVTTATDVYALGVLLYELLTGFRPFHFESSTPYEIDRVICTHEPERPSTHALRSPDRRLRERAHCLKGDLDNIVLMAMRKEPERRYSSAIQLSDDIRRYQEGFPVLARPDRWHYRTAKFLRRHRLAAAGAALFAIMIMAFTAGMAVLTARAERGRNRPPGDGFRRTPVRGVRPRAGEGTDHLGAGDSRQRRGPDRSGAQGPAVGAICAGRKPRIRL
jgi:serine/threonine protein kinase